MRADAGASLDALLRDLERLIADVELAEIPLPGSGPQHPRRAAAVIEALTAQIDRLCEQREINAREAQRSMALSERSVRANDDVRAMEALARHVEQLKLFHEADAQLNEFRALLTDVMRLLPKPEVAPSSEFIR